MGNNRHILTIIIITVILTGCEAYKTIHICVKDEQSKQPQEGVTVLINAGKNGDYNKAVRTGVTDSSGCIETGLMIGCAFGCYDIRITYLKSGYDSLVEWNKTEGTVMLHRTKEK